MVSHTGSTERSIMAIEFNFFVQYADDLDRALVVVQSTFANGERVLDVRADRFKPRLAEDISLEAGLPVVGGLTLWMTDYSRSIEATDRIIQGTLAAARRLTGSSALYVHLDS